MQNPNDFRPEPSAPKGHFVSRLTPEELAKLQAFNLWLKEYRKADGNLMTDGGRASYRTYVTQSMIALFHEGKAWKDLTTSQRSGWNLFCTFWDELEDEQVIEDLAEDDDEDDLEALTAPDETFPGDTEG